MTVIKTGIIWLERLIRIFEVVIAFILVKKEKILTAIIKNYWPRTLSANDLTSARLAIALIILPWVIFGEYRQNLALAAILVFALMTDLIDGAIARTLNQNSALGSLLDKIADKALVMPLGVIQFWPYDPWLVGLSLLGMAVVLVLGLIKYLLSNFRTVPENTVGKLCSVCYSLAIIIAIWPQAQIWADHLGWGGFFVGMVSIMQNFHRHFLAGK